MPPIIACLDRLAHFIGLIALIEYLTLSIFLMIFLFLLLLDRAKLFEQEAGGLRRHIRRHN